LKKFYTLFFSFFVSALLAQEPSNIIRGRVIDSETNFPVAFASVLIYQGDSLAAGLSCDSSGYFRSTKIPAAKYAINVTCVGYKSIWLNGIVLISAKETVLEIPLEQSINTTSVVQIKSQAKGVKNEMALLSVRSFDVEEANRYAGSRSDPARMASNFAGVQGSDDTRNDIVIRGNAPGGVLWRIDNADVPAPNHFSVPGTNGGPVSILNSKTLANSDFFTGAFPAEYGNGTAGVFDIKLRKGNNQKHEFTGQLGFLGTELAAEGPLNKKAGSSYLATFRYSTLQLFSLMNVNIGTTAIPRYYDGAFKLNFPLKNNANFSMFALGGRSAIEINISDKSIAELNELYGRRDRDQVFASALIIGGMNYSKSISAKTFFNVTLSGYYSQTNVDHDLVVRDSSLAVVDIYKKLIYNYTDYKTSLNVFVNHKLSSRSSIKAGLNYSELFFNLVQKDFDSTQNFTYRINVNNHAGLARGYIQMKHAFSEKLVLVGGVNAQYFLLNQSTALEPRASLRYQLTNNQSLSFGYGKHSQLQPGYVYLQNLTNSSNITDTWNKNIGFTKSDHYVLSYALALPKSFKIKVESYYQWLYNVPVEEKSSSFSMLNFGADARLQYPGIMKNTGTGRNYGLEFTFEKNFNKDYFLLFSASLFESKYKGSDGVERNTAFNGNYAANLLAGKEWKLDENSTLVLSAKVTRAGGRRYTPLNMSASNAAKDEIIDSTKAFSQQFKDYFRVDIKLGYRWNSPKITHELALDLVNVLNTKNVLRLTYVPPVGSSPASVVQEDQLHFLPLFYYRADF
jgi:hypothetical protein